ncbi:hypothetical protein HMPREF1062_04024 [Bacteroides cellulosilyticus CL02T12C19]|uniref:Uncharacterized protein n=1 Tax=Bacteroides cellulosilyticus CL02T12C19 TaxID=997874 RepID=I9QBW7_9BACE|nr:hypothetical protein HMPREF1062_04024 [Bacteroides cellulosilyticus CL02T12C19]
MRIKMNRTIKFRGKSADNGKWITGYYYHECGNTYIVEDRQSLSETSRNVPYVVIPETVGQFTGHRTEQNFFRYIRLTGDDTARSISGDMFFRK